MIRHCVFVRFRNDAADAERAAIHADLEALRAVIDGMGKVEFSARAVPDLTESKGIPDQSVL
ncbi:Dabb family protein [Mesorhizobium sp. M0998]|uniref:Dabb family protein n=1 Tax=Mesorhizobium sp. M0998 TaxID=2957044 RepID=UPI003337E845